MRDIRIVGQDAVAGPNRVALYTIVIELPPALPVEKMELWVRSAVNVNDTLIAHIRARHFQAMQLTPEQMAKLHEGLYDISTLPLR